MRLQAFIRGIGLVGPGLAGWPEGARALSGQCEYAPAPTVLPPPTLLPPTERRRSGRVVKLALAVASEAVAQAGISNTTLASVFSSSGADGHNCHEMCRMLAEAPREISPTRFTNSVHNAAAGYWSIASGSTAASTVLCAHDASFCAGLLEALAQVAAERRPVLLVAYDVEYPEPLHSKRPVPDAFGAALVLTPELEPESLARIGAALTDERADTLPDPRLEALRAAVPAARSLPLLSQLAAGATGRVVLDYLDPWRAGLEVHPCR